MAQSSKRFATLWAEQTEIDYYAVFIKSWIAFNAWLNHKYGDITDADKLKNLIESSNVRDAVLRTIREQNKTEPFLLKIARLHELLENKNFKNKEKRISLSNTQRNKTPTNTNEVIRGIHFTFKQEDGKNKCIIKNKKGSDLLNFIDSVKNYSLDKLEIKLQEATSLTEPQKQHARNFYKQLSTKEEVNLLDVSEGYYELGAFRFMKDEQLIFQSLINTIYDIRCVLFHGDVDPEDHKDIYEQAYYIVRFFIDNFS